MDGCASESVLFDLREDKRGARDDEGVCIMGACLISLDTHPDADPTAFS